MRVLVLLLLPLLASSYISSGVLDLHELHSVQYSIQMFDTPVSEDEHLEGLSTMMINKEGQKYRCSLPQVEETNDEQEKGSEEQVTDIASLLGPLSDGPCIMKTKEWWTYEICYSRDIKQYHIENEKPVGAIMILGVHSAGLDNWEPSNRTYQPQWYTNGSRCDLTGRSRQTELRFVCNEAASVEFIGDIFEPQSCEYTIVVHTAKLCNVPWLKPVAETTPLPIQCNPLLSGDQFNRYQLYQDKKKALATRLAEEQKRKAEEKAALQGTSQSSEIGALDGIFDFVGDNMADKLFSELNSMLDSALTGGAQTGIKVIDLRQKDKIEEIDISESSKEIKMDNSIKKEEDIFTPDGKWNLLNTVQKPILDEEYRSLIVSRNDIYRKIHETKKEVKKLSSQLQDTKTFLENESIDVFKNGKVMDKLTLQQKTLEKAVLQAKEKLRLYEGASKDVSHMIVGRQGHLKLLEEQLWKGRIEILVEMMKQGATDFTPQLKDMADDYRKVTNERLLRIDDYFKVAKNIVDTEQIEDFDKLIIFMKFADGELLGIAEIDGEEIASFNREIDQLSEEQEMKTAKFRDVIKDDVREKFGEILKEVSEELELPDGDSDKDEAMKAMGETLDQLIGKLAGSGDRLTKVQKHVSDLKKLTADQEETDKIVSLKRDNKKSVKKDLWVDENGYARGNIPGIHEIEETESDKEVDGENDVVKEDEELDKTIEEGKLQLQEEEEEVSKLEDIIKDLTGKPQIPNKPPAFDLDKVKVSVTKVSAMGDSTALDDEEAAKIVKRLEGTLKDKLSKLGLDMGGRPIEVKLITTTLPEGIGGDGDDQQVQSMMYNMMVGNIQGYEDIDNQRKAESSYKFSWEDNMVEEVDKKIESLGEASAKSSDETGENNVSGEETVISSREEFPITDEIIINNSDQLDKEESPETQEDESKDEL